MGKFRLDMKALDLDPAGVILEIGSEHGGGSTEKLYEFAESKRMIFYTVDFDPEIIKKIPNKITKFNCTGQDFLKAMLPEYDHRISFVYLDNYDYEFPEIVGKRHVVRQHKRYAALGIGMTNEASEVCHLEQAQLCHEMRMPVMYILMDDTYQRTEGGMFEGKGARVVPWALEQGYDILETDKVGCNPWDGYVLLRHVNLEAMCEYECCLEPAVNYSMCAEHRNNPITGGRDG